MPRDPSVPPWWQILLAVEVVVAAISIAMVVTPSKTGSDWSPAQELFVEPSFLQEWLVYFVFTNGVCVMLAVVFWVYLRRQRGDP